MTEQKEFEFVFRGVATVDDRGQMVIPIEARKVAGFKNGAKIAVFTAPSNLDDGKLKIVLTLAQYILDMKRVKKLLG
ncbi:MAG: AbrB/MazE/SpoVT family DNA-binding domain-containing protein [Patescibacteria group bacterium]|nr:MAG: AbrB/MazE/SpoVT family DNA-binding domain-containing protein [Patescibacteria group bacterium]